MNEEPYVGTELVVPGAPRIRRASWGAIFAGAFVSVVVQIMFLLLGAAIGFAIIRPAQGQSPSQDLALGSVIWLLVTGLVSTWVGACVAGRLSGGPRPADGMLHGIVTWSVSVVAMFLLLASTAGAALSGVGALLGGAIGTGAVVQAQSGQSLQNAVAAAQDSVKKLFPRNSPSLVPTGRTESQQAPGQLTQLAKEDPQLMTVMARMEANGGANQSQTDRQQVINLLTTKHNLSQEEAEKLVNQWDQNSRQERSRATQEAKQVGQSVAQGVSSGALWGFISLFLGLCVAAWGGWSGTTSLRRPASAPAAG